MFEYLINTTEVYRVDTEKEAAELINNAKQNREYDLAKYSSTKKERKQDFSKKLLSFINLNLLEK